MPLHGDTAPGARPLSLSADLHPGGQADAARRAVARSRRRAVAHGHVDEVDGVGWQGWFDHPGVERHAFVEQPPEVDLEVFPAGSVIELQGPPGSADVVAGARLAAYAFKRN